MDGSHSGQQLRFLPFDLLLTLGFVLSMHATDASSFTMQEEEGALTIRGLLYFDIEPLAANTHQKFFHVMHL